MKLQTYLKQNKISNVEFAKKAGVVPSAVGNWLKGQLPSPNAVLSIHKATRGRVTPNDLFGVRS